MAMDSKSKESFGQYLRRERTLREIPLEEIAQFTKIKLSTLARMENDDFAHMPNIAFVRGFVRAYAEYLGLNLQEVMYRFTTYIEENFPDMLASPVAVKPRRGINRPLILGLFAFLIAGFFFYSYRYMSRLENRQVGETLPGGSVETSPAVERPKTPETVKEKAKQKIRLNATELCWIQVILDDLPPYEATLYPGDSVSYEAEERIRLLVGNAGGIKIRYKDSSLENLGPSGRPIRLIFPESTGTPISTEQGQSPP